MIDAFYINRDRDTARRERIEEQLERAGTAAERVSGIEGRNPPAWLPVRYGKNLTDGEVGCSASHLAAAQIIVDRGLKFALVVEDDAILAPRFLVFVYIAIKKLPKDWDYLKLCRTPKRSVSPVDTCAGRFIVRYSRIPMGCAGYVLSQAGARKLLTPRVVENAIDVEVAQPWLLDLNVFGISPPIVTTPDASANPSTIGSTRAKSVRSIGASRVLFNVRKLGVAAYVRCWVWNVAGRRLLRSSSQA